MMVLHRWSPPGLDVVSPDLDAVWAERLGAETERYERVERRSGWRRAGACLLAAAVVVVLGVVGFRYETDTRVAPVRDVPSPGWVTVTLPHRPVPPSASAATGNGAR